MAGVLRARARGLGQACRKGVGRVRASTAPSGRRGRSAVRSARHLPVPSAGCLGVVPVLGQVNVEPDASALPGGAQLQQIVNGVAAFSLVVLVGAVIAGAVLWAYGSATSTYNNINGGKRMVLISALGAIIVGGAAALINFFTAMGGQI
jgi:hypothetical protein